jgi:hypothetical protein
MSVLTRKIREQTAIVLLFQQDEHCFGKMNTWRSAYGTIPAAADGQQLPVHETTQTNAATGCRNLLKRSNRSL